MRQLRVIVPMLAWLAWVAMVGPGLADDWPQWLGPQRDAVWRETGIIEKFPATGPPLLWHTAIGAGYAGPAVAQGRVFVTDRLLPPSASNPAKPVVGKERVLCLNQADGKVLWQHEYDCHYDLSYPAGPRTTPAVDSGKVYTLGATGHLLCLEASSGKVLWTRQLKDDFGIATPMWGFSSHPLVDGLKLICLAGGAGTTIVAFDKHTGREIWRALTAREPGYCPPVIYEAAGRRQLIVWHPESLNSLDPETGQVYWSAPFTVRSGLTIATPRKLGDRLFVTSFYNGSLMVRLEASQPKAREIWRGRVNNEYTNDGLHGLMCTPFLEDGYIYGVCSYGQFRCLNADTGAQLWETFAPTCGQRMRWGNAFIVKQGPRFFLFNEKGDLIVARLSPQGYDEICRTHLLEPTNTSAGRDVVWSHPAFANRCIYARNDKQIICASLASETYRHQEVNSEVHADQ